MSVQWLKQLMSYHATNFKNVVKYILRSNLVHFCWPSLYSCNSVGHVARWLIYNDLLITSFQNKINLQLVRLVQSIYVDMYVYMHNISLHTKYSCLYTIVNLEDKSHYFAGEAQNLTMN